MSQCPGNVLCFLNNDVAISLLFTPFAELVYRGSASRGAEDSPEKQARLQSTETLIRG